MRWLSLIWSFISDQMIRNHWKTTGIIPSFDTDAAFFTLPVEAEDMAALKSFINIVLPNESRRA